jgi:hypothetical protein
VNVGSVLEAFRTAVSALGNTPPKTIPNVKVIDHGSR